MPITCGEKVACASLHIQLLVFWKLLVTISFLRNNHPWSDCLLFRGKTSSITCWFFYLDRFRIIKCTYSSLFPINPKSNFDWYPHIVAKRVFRQCIDRQITQWTKRRTDWWISRLKKWLADRRKSMDIKIRGRAE